MQERESLEDDVRTGRPKGVRTERKIQQVATLVRANHSQSVDIVISEVGVSHCTCYKILIDDLNMSLVIQHTEPRILSQDQRADRAVGVSHCTCYKILTDDLNMSRVIQHTVPRILSQNQRDDRMTICGDSSVVLDRIITGDGTIFLYGSQLKRHLKNAINTKTGQKGQGNA